MSHGSVGPGSTRAASPRMPHPLRITTSFRLVGGRAPSDFWDPGASSPNHRSLTATTSAPTPTARWIMPPNGGALGRDRLADLEPPQAERQTSGGQLHHVAIRGARRVRRRPRRGACRLVSCAVTTTAMTPEAWTSPPRTQAATGTTRVMALRATEDAMSVAISPVSQPMSMLTTTAATAPSANLAATSARRAGRTGHWPLPPGSPRSRRRR